MSARFREEFDFGKLDIHSKGLVLRISCCNKKYNVPDIIPST